jgi:PAS domain S-box-containing protein
MSSGPGNLSITDSTRIHLWRWAAALSALCLAPAVLAILGVDFSTFRDPLDPFALQADFARTIHHALHGDFVHTILEWSSVSAAVFVGVLALVQFRISRDPSLPVIGVAVASAGAVDVFHVLAADRLITSTASDESLIPFTWAIARLFHGTILLIGIAYVVISRPGRPSRSAAWTYGLSGAFVVLAYVVIRQCATSASLPTTIFPDAWIKRPYDVYALLVYALCVALMPRYLAASPSLFRHSLALSLVPHLLCQGYMALGSTAIFDSWFNIAHALKTTAYLVPAGGLVIGFVRIDRERTAALATLRHVRDSLEERSRALAASEARTWAVMDVAADGILTVDEAGRIQSFNQAAERMFGYRAEELLGQTLDMLMANRPTAPLSEHLRQFYAAAERRASGAHAEDLARHRDGHTFPVEVDLSHVHLDDSLLYVAIVRDVSERNRAHRALAEQARIGELNTAVGMSLTRQDSLRSMLQACTDAAVEHLDAAFCRIWTLNVEEQVLELRASSGMYTHIDGGHARVPVGAFKIGRIAQSRRPHLNNDVQHDPQIGDPEWARREGMVAFAGHPLIVEDELVGVAALFSRTPLSDVVLSALGSIADGLALGIKRKLSEARLEAMQQQLVRASRRAGMAEVATNVLHNVGNVLNSLNVSATVVGDHVRGSRVKSVAKAAALMKQHENDLADFLLRDENGRRLVPYLTDLGAHLVAEQNAVLTELCSLTKNIEHIKHVVSRQGAYAGNFGVIEPTDVAAVVQDALEINQTGLTRHGVRVKREFGELPRVPLDKHKLLEILVNLIRNAKEAMHGIPADQKVLTLRAARDGDIVQIEVEDHGVGIDANDLKRIFAHGFTTKKDGHGFGLHSSVLAADELGGSLTARSEGPGHGARFTLRLSIQKVEAGNDAKLGAQRSARADRG